MSGEGRLWARLRAAIKDGDEDALAGIRAEYGTKEALQAALMAEASRVKVVTDAGFVVDKGETTPDGGGTLRGR